MSDKKHYRDRVDVRFDDRFRFNRHRERAEKKRRENCVKHAGGEIISTILDHICIRVVVNVCITSRARSSDDISTERKHSSSVSSFEEFPIRNLHLTLCVH